MKSFKNFSEEVVEFPLAHLSHDGKHETFVTKQLNNKETKDWLNVLLIQATVGEYSNPYPCLTRVAKVLASFGIQLPRAYFPDITGGELVFGVSEHGQLVDYNKSIPTEDSEIPEHFLYFEYGLSEQGTYVCYAEIVDLEGLESLMDEEDEDNQPTA